MAATAGKTTVRVFLWDDAERVRTSARAALESDPRFTVVGEAAAPSDALARIAEQRPDVVLLDLAMPELDGLAALPRIGEAAPDARVLIYSSFEAAEMERPARARGACGYVEKGASPEALRAAVHEIAQGPTGLGSVERQPAPVTVPSGSGSPGARAVPGAVELAAERPRRRAVLPGTITSGPLAVAVAAVLYLAIFLIPILTPTRIDGIALLGTLPTALLAMRFGLRGGLPAAGIALLEILLLSSLDEVRATGALPWVARALVFLLLGGLLGLVVDRAREAFAALAAANHELERSNQDLEQFAYAASHDLSEPLRGIAGFADLLRRRYHGRLDESADDFIDQISGSAERLRLLVDDLLAYARTGSGEVKRRPVGCDELVGRVVTALAVPIKETGAAVEVASLPRIDADPRLLGQVFQNLIGNGLKFTGGEAPSVRVSAERGHGEYRFAVADDGIGVPAGDEERIFQVFKRLHGREEYDGTGMGLAICKRAVERHGGTIWVESLPGGGSVFRFTIADPADTR